MYVGEVIDAHMYTPVTTLPTCLYHPTCLTSNLPPHTQDSIAELNEVFLVRLTSVTLVSPQNNTIPPSIGAQMVSEVTITPNDSPQGEFTFLQDS